MKKFLCTLSLLALLLTFLPLPEAEAAGTAVDYLTVKVGYFGMKTDKYVEAGKYHWTELQNNLDTFQAAYTFYRPGTDGEYRVVVDSAYGFRITDLLEYARISTGDIQSVEFYTDDQEVGAFTSFTWSDLTRTRYYFDNLPLHIAIGDAWGHANAVEPMLALEDSWVTYDVGTENVYPNYESMGTGNRFRLLFGQTEPTESRTNQSAKYTHTVFVTLKGGPKVVEEPKALDGTIGSHTAQMTLSLDDPSLLEHLQELLEFTSSDGTVLRIDGFTVTPDARYSDLVTITLNYSILKSGSASISGNIGGLALTTSPQTDQPDDPVSPDTPQPSQPDNTGQNSTSGSNTTGSGGTSQLDRILDQWAAQAPASSESNTASLGNRTLIPLTAQQAEQLRQGVGRNPEEDTPTGSDSSPEEKQDDLRLALALTGLGALLLAAAGSIVQTLQYRKERKS